MPEIPTPQDTGSTGTQEASAGELVRVQKESPFKGLPITQMVEGLAATHSRSMGGEVAANLIAGSFTQLSHDLQSTRTELTENRNQLRKVNSDLAQANQRCAVLEERVRIDTRYRQLKNLCIFAGTSLIGIGIELYKNSFEKFGYITAGLGALLLVFGWFSTGGRPEG